MVIYLITNKVSGKKYVGQTIKPLRIRWSAHTTNKNNLPMYDDMRKLGKEAFEIKVIRRCKTVKLLCKWEKILIKKLKTLEPNGYNICKGGKNIALSPMALERSAAKRRKIFTFVGPDSLVYITNNLPKFCSDRGLIKENMSTVSRKHHETYKGWRSINYAGRRGINYEKRDLKVRQKNIKTYKFVSDKGENICFFGHIYDFCKQHGLPKKASNQLSKVNRGIYKSAYGFKTTKPYPELRLGNTRIWKLRNPAGKIIKITNLKEFCRKEKLSYSQMFSVGKKSCKNHRGWTCPSSMGLVGKPIPRHPRKINAIC